MKGTPSSCAAVWWQVPASPMKGTSYNFATPTTARAKAMSRAVIPYTAPCGLICADGCHREMCAAAEDESGTGGLTWLSATPWRARKPVRAPTW